MQNTELNITVNNEIDSPCCIQVTLGMLQLNVDDGSDAERELSYLLVDSGPTEIGTMLRGAIIDKK
jgi:hypothetical protein